MLCYNINIAYLYTNISYVGFRNLNKKAFLKEYCAVSTSHIKYTFEDQDNLSIDKLRKWMISVFKSPNTNKSNSLSYPFDVKLENRSNHKQKNIDVSGEIKQKKDLKNEMMLIIEDETD